MYLQVSEKVIYVLWYGALYIKN